MLILVAHGSRDPQWRSSLEGLAEAVKAKMQNEEVLIAFMQFDGPTLSDVVKEAVQAGHESLRLLPLFMASAGHVDKDIKPLINDLARTYSGVEFILMTPVGEDDLFPRLIVDITTAMSGPS